MSEHYHFTDRPEAAHGLEDDSESAWEEFQQLASSQPALAGARPPVAGPAIGRANHAGRWQLQDLIALMQRQQRVCPRPEAWIALHALLLRHAQAHDKPLPPPPTDHVAWHKTSLTIKAICFEDHLRWAERRADLFQEAAEFLAGLDEEEWQHRDPAPPLPH